MLMRFTAPVASMIVSVRNLDVSVWVQDLLRHVIETFSELVTANRIRLVAIIGGYLLFRPRLLRLLDRHQTSQLQQEGQIMPVSKVSDTTSGGGPD